jgi:raffinose/stachyose/melibiose transport system substrate-binding protein
MGTTVNTPRQSFKRIVAIAMCAWSVVANAAPVTLKIESWRYDDLPVWRDKIIPAFEKKHPDIRVVFTPTPPAEYDNRIAAKLASGSAGDLITCRPFDVSLKLFAKGQLLPLDGLPGMSHFTPIARLAWTTDDGATTFCVPIAAVIHGFIYNVDAFETLRIKPPATVREFFAVLDHIKADGRYIPLVMGTKDGWESATMGYQNIGPNSYRGEEGRKALIAGTAKLTDAAWVEPFRALAKWRPYLGEGFEAQTYPDSQNLFTLGRGAIYPAGSWEIADFEKQAGFRLGVFRPPTQHASDKCFISDHPDIALGINARSPHSAEAKVFLDWVASPEFAALYSNALPGFFSLNRHAVALKSPLARAFVGWRNECASTPRSTCHMLSRGTPNLETEYWRVSADVIEGSLTPDAAAQQLQAVLQRTHKPRPVKEQP